MEANELRLRNLISYISKDKIIEVTSLEIECAEGMNGHFNTTFKPIELTEEWLLKLGFKKADKSDEFGGYLSPLLPNGNKFRIKDNWWNTQHISVKIEYVHQLQNLYFSLTEKELTLNQKL